MQQMCVESEISIRNIQNYDTDLATQNPSLTGVIEPSIFHQIPYFHCTNNIVCDFMHDIPEGVARYDMALIIYGLIKQKYFTLEELNNRIIMFNYGVTEKKILLQLFEIVILKKVVLLCLHRKCYVL